MKTAHLDSLKIHDISDPTCKFFLTQPVNGIAFPSIRSTQMSRAGEGGIYLSNLFTNERRVQLEGYINGVDGQADLITQRRLLAAICAPVKDEYGQPVDRVFRFTGMDDVEYRIVGQILRLDIPYANPSSSRFSIDFLATREAIEAYAATTTAVVTRTGGGFVLPALFPVTFGASIGGDATVVNAGDAPAYPVVTLAGPLTNPRLENTTTGRHISLTLTIGAGETVVIDMRNRTIVQGGVTNRMDRKSSDSKFWWLNPGNNTVRLTTTISGEAGTASIEYRSSWYGV